jgi:hypothetical protein
MDCQVLRVSCAVVAEEQLDMSTQGRRHPAAATYAFMWDIGRAPAGNLSVLGPFQVILPMMKTLRIESVVLQHWPLLQMQMTLA